LQLLLAALLLPVALEAGSVVASGRLQQPLGRPVVGILASPLPLLPGELKRHPTRSFIPSRYVTSLAAAGADSVPLPLFGDKAELRSVVEQLSAVLFTGGGDDDGVHGKAFPDDLVVSAQLIYNLSSEAGTRGEAPLPIWGTCQGFQLLSVLAAANPKVVVRTYGTEGLIVPVNFTAAARSSRLFAGASAEVLEAYTRERSTVNLHKWGVLQKEYGSGGLVDGMRVLSTNVDSQGQIFASSMEHETLPIYATQFHPEILPSRFGGSKTSEALAAAAYPMRFFVGSEAARSGRSFADAAEERRHLIQRFPLTNLSPFGGNFSFTAYIFEGPQSRSDAFLV